MRKVLIATLLTFTINASSFAEDATFEGDMVFVPPTYKVDIEGDNEVGIGEYERNQKAKILSEVKVPVAKDFKGSENGKAPKQIILKLNKKGEVVDITDGKAGYNLSEKKSKTNKRAVTW